MEQFGYGSVYCTGNRRFNYLNSHYKIRKYEEGVTEVTTRIYATVIGDSTFTFNGACRLSAGELLVRKSIELVKKINKF